ncbi:sulfotransferase family protein [Winogradskyella sediminis]|uniref:sulfotransferase family protein n=1 Tax=Winogradskyella sediminis TaxID=1382466 RepID=UPI000E3A0824|nr:sulfotransferase [Winogradskyella sediminis]REG89971.1 sulfotransferase family protein [Winogradskyella sediminis]
MKNNPIFIIGVSRTGSKFYMQLLNSHPDICILPELMFKHPHKKDLFSEVELKLQENNLEALVESLYLFKERATYTNTIKLVDRELLKSNLANLEYLKPYTVLNSILKLAALSKNKKQYGAKFPIHYSYTAELLHANKNSRIIYLTRDPRAIFYSDYRKKRDEQKNIGNNFPIKGMLLKPAVLFYTILEWKKSMTLFKKMKKSKLGERIKLFKFESIIIEEEQVIKSIAKFIDEKPDSFSTENMKIMDSSFSEKPKLNRWKNNLNTIEKLIFKISIGRKMKEYGYL